jgi:hypothetical protein
MRCDVSDVCGVVCLVLITCPLSFVEKAHHVVSRFGFAAVCVVLRADFAAALPTYPAPVRAASSAVTVSGIDLRYRLDALSVTPADHSAVGHIAENCQAPGRLCYNCREPGHESTNCPQPRSTDGKQCYACGGVGECSAVSSIPFSSTHSLAHPDMLSPFCFPPKSDPFRSSSRLTESGPGVLCTLLILLGHVKADCPSMRGSFGFGPGAGAGPGAFAGGQKCYQCGRPGEQRCAFLPSSSR